MGRNGEDQSQGGAPSGAGGMTNQFQNDGSFMEMFKKKLAEEKETEEAKQESEQKVLTFTKYIWYLYLQT